jgi:Transglycosylase SLT domain
MMRRLNTSTLLAVALFFTQPAIAGSDQDKPVASAASTESSVSEAAASTAPAESVELLDPLKGPIDETVTLANSPEVSELLSESFAEPLKERVQFSREEICQMIEEAASGEALPFEFLARLIWQESKFDPQAVSPAGAQGIAQFMPKTATGRGLGNPFEPAAALHESAEFLRELLDRFGNLGLAAAAYNAGPKRVQDWLAKRSALPRETQQYVHIITGHRPEVWAASAPQPAGDDLQEFRCAEIAKMAAKRRSTATIEKLASLVAQRMAQKSRAEESASQGRREAAGKGRNAARNGIIGKRGTVAAKAGREQVTKVVVQSVKGRKIIKITAQGREEPRLERVTKIMVEAGKKSRGEKNVKVAAATRNAARGEKVAQASSRRSAKDGSKPMQIVGKFAGKTSSVSSQKKKGPVRVAANTHGSDSKSCSAKSARKSCRAA